MRNPFVRLAIAAVGVAVVMSCDAPPAAPRFGNGISGGSTGTGPVTPPNPSLPDTTHPFARIDTPSTTGQLFNVGDSILVVTRIIDDRQLNALTVQGIRYKGNANLGTLVTTFRYTPITAPTSGVFRTGLTDTVIRRYLQPSLPVDTAIDSLVIMAILSDAAGNIDTAFRRVNIVTGPKVVIEAPGATDTVPVGVPMNVRLHVTHPDGVRSDTIHIKGEPTWPAAARLDTTIVVTYSGQQRDVVVDTNIMVPALAPINGKITITAAAVDVNRNPGSAPPVVVVVRAQGTTAPKVTTELQSRLELDDSITVIATGDGITAVGYIIRDSAGTILKQAQFPVSPVTSNVRKNIPLAPLSDTLQGRHVQISTFAVDASTPPLTGYSVKVGTAGVQTDPSLAFQDTALVVFGLTYALPRNGIVGDIAADESRGNVFLSNLSFNRLEVWQVGSRAFYAPGVAVGSQPWGLARTNNPDSLLVGNSGGTNVSKVFIGSTNPAAMSEDLAHRVRTRTAPLFEVTEVIDVNSNKINIAVGDPLLFSNRPQYVGQIADGTIFFSTRPTTEAPKGIVHYFDPSQPFPDLHTIVNFKQKVGLVTSLVMDVDSIYVRPAIASSGLPDTLVVWDHTPGTLNPSDSVRTVNGVGAALAGIQAKVNSDMQVIPRVDVSTIGMTDTTFVAVSGDRNWIAFGSGNTAGAGDVFMASPGFFSPIFSQVDLTNNASEHVFGLALDSTGVTVGAHGASSYFASVDVPFHLRLQGLFDTFNTGAGIAFHPAARGTTTANPLERLGFVASDDATIQVMDIAHYLSAGTLPIKTKLYGPLRVTRRFPSDPPEVVLKLYGVSTEGLVVIDVRCSASRCDVSPVP
ncbi:MAG TPA: hypothetical protein VJ867_05630 [Gemmatimonadaceae bacterium]|nr:hypothetical protein [Gemmatimonadaceae bacterium]